MSKKSKKWIIIVIAVCVIGIVAFIASNISISLPQEVGEESNNYSATEALGNGDTVVTDYDDPVNGLIAEGNFGDNTAGAIQLLMEEYSKYKFEAESDPVRQKEVTLQELAVRTETGTEYMDVCTINMQDRQMKYTMDIIGSPDENGLYPLYITLHGGGEASEEENNSQWLAMKDYYSESVSNGIYVAVRGMEDVWNLHFLDDSYPMYDRLIEDMIMLKNADPNRVYLLGFSAGGDGVYAIAPRMADRFAAVNMSSGHPNDVSLLNTSNLPFEIQVGIRDYYSDTAMRSIRGAEFEDILNGYNKDAGFGYPHRVLVHVPDGHEFNDSYVVTQEFLEMYGLTDVNPDKLKTYVLKDPALFARRAVEENWLEQFLEILASIGEEPSFYTLSYESPGNFDDLIFQYVKDELDMEVIEEETNAIHFVDSYTRDPMPEVFVWDLETRASRRKDTAFYWLKADSQVNQGLVKALYDAETNTVYLEEVDEINGDITILASPFLFDFDRPLTVVTAEGEFTTDLKPDSDIIADSVRQTGDIYLSWADEVDVGFSK